jgi:hypothetical protein
MELPLRLAGALWGHLVGGLAPIRRTDSLCRLGLTAPLLLVLGGGEGAEARVSSALVIEDLDTLEDGPPERRPGWGTSGGERALP